MISKESLILIAVLIVLVVGFMVWSDEQSENIQNSVDQKIENLMRV